MGILKILEDSLGIPWDSWGCLRIPRDFKGFSRIRRVEMMFRIVLVFWESLQ